MAAVVTVEHLRKVYGPVTAVDDISFTVEKGEIFGLLGPNGAGKTTTVECLEGLRRPDGGRVEVLGLDPQSQGDELRQRIGVQLQEAALPDRIKVREALDLFASLYDRRIVNVAGAGAGIGAGVGAEAGARAEAEAEANPAGAGAQAQAGGAANGVSQTPGDSSWQPLLAELGLADKTGALFAKLSGGQKQRLFIALALINDPELVFLDELTAGLDPQARRTIWELVERVRQRGKTIVLITHFMDEAEHLCDRVAIVDHGRLIALGKPADLVRNLGAEVRVVLTARPVQEGAWERPGVGLNAVEQALAGVPDVVRVEGRGRPGGSAGLGGSTGSAVSSGSVGSGGAGDSGSSRGPSERDERGRSGLTDAGGELIVVHGRGADLVAEVVIRLHAAGIRVQDLRTEQASLDDVFLALTGRQMRD